MERLAPVCRWLEALEKTPASPDEEAAWRQAELRLDNWMAAVLRPSPPIGRKELSRAPKRSGWLLRWAWAPIFAIALAIIALHYIPNRTSAGQTTAVLQAPPKPSPVAAPSRFAAPLTPAGPAPMASTPIVSAPAPAAAPEALPAPPAPLPAETSVAESGVQPSNTGQLLTPQAAEARLGMPITASYHDGRLTLAFSTVALVFQNDRLVATNRAPLHPLAPAPQGPHVQAAVALLSTPLPAPPPPAPAPGFTATVAWANSHSNQIATPQMASAVLGQPLQVSFRDTQLVFLYAQVQLTYRDDRLVSVQPNPSEQK